VGNANRSQKLRAKADKVEKESQKSVVSKSKSYINLTPSRKSLKTKSLEERGVRRDGERSSGNDTTGQSGIKSMVSKGEMRRRNIQKTGEGVPQ